MSGGPQSGVVGEKGEEMGGDVEAIKDKSGKPKSLLVSTERAVPPYRGQNNRGASIQVRSTETLTENLRADRGSNSRAHSQRWVLDPRTCPLPTLPSSPKDVT